MEKFQDFLYNFQVEIEKAKTQVKTDEDLANFDKLISEQIDFANKRFSIEVSSLLEHTGLRVQLNKMAVTINEIKSLDSYEIDISTNKITLIFNNSYVVTSLIDLNLAAKVYFKLDPADLAYVFLLSYLSSPEQFDIIQVYNAFIMNCSPHLH